ncbi:MAG: Uma2 family endonuclease [Myxococcales bacterium]|nr:Uma2 family endonuclease [Myxococcales bacterium]
MRDPQTRDATYEDLKALPENMVGQIVEGVLIAMPRPAVGHAFVTSTLGADLHGPFGRGRGGPGGWIFLDEPELHFDRNVLVPDIAAWRRERMPELPTASTPFLTLAPDWVCEVLSPRTASVDRVQKRRVYAREKVGYLWIIDPLERVLTAYALDGADFRELGTWGGDEDRLLRVAPFDAIELDLTSLWAPQPPP